jgi:phage recombination protein Bet
MSTEKTALAAADNQQIATTNGNWWEDPKIVELITRKVRRTCAKAYPNVSDDEIGEFIYLAKTVNLDPIRNQIYAIPRDSRLTFQVGIDGFRAIAHRTGQYTGMTRKAVYSDGRLVAAWAIATRNGREWKTSVLFNEYNTGKNVWREKPETMILKVAEAHALRMAFPEELGGMYTEDELPSEPINITPQVPRIPAPGPDLDELNQENVAWAVRNGRQDLINDWRRGATESDDGSLDNLNKWIADAEAAFKAELASEDES